MYFLLIFKKKTPLYKIKAYFKNSDIAENLLLNSESLKGKKIETL